MRAVLDRPAFCRVTLLTPARRVDVALPVDVPLAELVPMVLELIGEPRRPHGLVGWRFSGASGGPLPPGATLESLGVPDGELLRFGPHLPAPAAPVFDDPVEAVAATAGASGPAAGPAVRAGVPVAGSVVAAGLVVLAARDAAGLTVLPAVLLAASGAVACLVLASGAARRADLEIRRAARPSGPDAPGADSTAGRRAGLAAVVAAVCAVTLAAAAGWTALPGPAGAGQLLVAAAVAGTVAAVGQVLVRVIAPVLVAVVVAAVVLVVVALLRLWLVAPPAALAAGALTVALAVGPLLGRVALRMAGLPQPSVPTDSTELLAADRLDRLSPAELADRTDLARGHLAGLVAGTATVAAVAAVPVAAAGGWLGPVTAVVAIAVVGLRVRGFADAAPARACLVAALAGAAGVAGVLAAAGGPTPRLVVAGVVGAAAVAAVAFTGRAEPVTSPVSRRAVDLLESTLLAATVPLALGVMDVYALVRGL
jgi:type VII secretion integral membrane protein EccD